MEYFNSRAHRRVVSGRLERRPGSMSSTTDPLRPVVLVFLVVGVILIITNPYNKLLPRGAFNSQVLSMMDERNRWIRAFRTHTNYLFFTLTNDLDSIYLSMLLRSIPICGFAATPDDYDLFLLQEEFCQYVSNNLCHGKPLWPGGGDDLPVTVFRVLAMIQLVAWLGVADIVLPRIRRYPTLYWPLSVLDVSANFLDLCFALLQLDLVVFPAMQSLHRLLRTYLFNKERVGIHFLLSCSVLLFGIGGLSNYLGASIRQQRRRRFGLDGAVASCMGYQAAINRSFSYNWLGTTSLSPSIPTLFWLRVGLYVLVEQQNMGALVAFCVGGMLGHFFGLAQRDWLYEHLVESWRMAGGRFVDKLFGGIKW